EVTIAASKQRERSKEACDLVVVGGKLMRPCEFMMLRSLAEAAPTQRVAWHRSPATGSLSLTKYPLRGPPYTSALSTPGGKMPRSRRERAAISRRRRVRVII